jgi:exopolysaccharide biosynthesis polyprenyl glycosylphosphotransferase
MFRRFSVDFALLSMVIDAGLILLNLVLAAVYRPVLNGFPLVKELFGYQSLPLLLYPVFPAIWIFCLLFLSVYHPGQNLRWEEETASLSTGSLLAGISMAGVLYITYRDISRALFLSFYVLSFLSIVGWRIAIRLLLRIRGRRIAPQYRVLIIGAGMVGKDLQEKILGHTGVHIDIVGFLDDDAEKLKNDPAILDNLDNVRKVVLERAIDHVILALPRRVHERVNRLVADLHDLPVRVYVIPDYFALTLYHAIVDEFAGIPMLDLRAPALTEYQRLLKRAFDLASTLALLPVVLPLICLISIIIRISSPGPVILKQHRVGENGKLFGMYKFRTMVANADELQHLVERIDDEGKLIHKSHADPRVTQLGGFLRKTSLDELPQFFNIFLGEMSLVGPRPEMPRLVEKYEPWQRKRFAVPPGLTGWWQVHGRSDKPMHLHTEEDLYYIQHYSPWLDLAILFQTVGAVLSRRGAY